MSYLPGPNVMDITRLPRHNDLGKLPKDMRESWIRPVRRRYLGKANALRYIF